MYCPNCGTFNEEDALFCQSCGTKLEEPVQEINDTLQVEPAQQTETIQQTEPIQQTETVQQAGPAVVPVEPVTSVPQKPKSKRTIILLGEVVVLVILLWAGFSLGKKSVDAKHVAADYFVNIVNGDWEKAYSLLDVTESDFINEKMFAKANENTTYGKINNYQVMESSSGFFKASGLQSGLGTDVTVNYRTKGSEGDNSMAINLTKQADKKYVVFDNWKVSTEQLITTDYNLYIPTGATVTFDGEKVDKKYMDAEAEGSDHYILPEVFNGTHKIKVTMEDMEDFSTDIQIGGDDNFEFYLENMALTEDGMTKLMELAGANMKQIYTAASKGEKFDTIENLFSANYTADIEDSYDELVSFFEGTEYETLTNIEFKNVKAEVYGTYVTMSFDYTASYKYGSRADTYSDSSEFDFYFQQEDGEWLLTNLGCRRLYY